MNRQTLACSPMGHLFLIVGLPGAGKTTTARRLEGDHGALRLTPDEWMIPLFDDHDANGMRDVLEGRLITVGLRVASLGTPVILDFGFWGYEERASLRSIAATLGISCTVVYLAADVATLTERLERRWRDTPETTFEITAADLAGYRLVFAEPDEGELSGGPLRPLPPGLATWADYALGRWPSLVLPAYPADA